MKKKKFWLYLLFPLVVGALVGFITSGDMKSYDGFVPAWIFPVVWSILYLLMGLSSYLVREDNDAINIYKVNLIFNYAWTFIFFTFNMKFLAFVWLILLIGIVFYIVYKFYKVNKVAGYLQIFYCLWLIFALFLNFVSLTRQ